MSGLAALFGRTLLIGVAVAAPVGAMGVLCVQRVLAGGFSRGAATGLGIATADGAYAAVAAFGVSALSAALVSAQPLLRVVGGVALVVLGVRAALTRPGQSRAGSDTATTFGATYTSAVGLTLTNPMTIMAFGAVFASAGLATTGGVAEAATATVGVALGSLSWWLVLSAAVASVRHALGARAMRAISVVSGLAVAAFGVYAAVSGLLVR